MIGNTRVTNKNTKLVILFDFKGHLEKDYNQKSMFHLCWTTREELAGKKHFH